MYRDPHAPCALAGHNWVRTGSTENEQLWVCLCCGQRRRVWFGTRGPWSRRTRGWS